MPRGSWKHSYSRDGIPQDPETAAALEAFLTTERWDFAYRILETNREILLSGTVINSLRKRITYLRKHPEECPWDIEHLVKHLQFLKEAHAQGISTAWEKLNIRLRATTTKEDFTKQGDLFQTYETVADESGRGREVRMFAEDLSEITLSLGSEEKEDSSEERLAEILWTLVLADTPKMAKDYLEMHSKDLINRRSIYLLQKYIDHFNKIGDVQLAEELILYLRLLEDVKHLGFQKAWNVHQDRLTYSFARSYVSIILEKFVSSDNWQVAGYRLEQMPVTLLSDTSLTLLKRGCDQYRDKGFEQLAEAVKKYVYLIEDARTRGIASAWSDFQHKFSVVGVLRLIEESDIPSELFSLMNTINSLASEEKIRKISLLTEAITLVDHARYPRLWSYLHNDRGHVLSSFDIAEGQEQAIADYNTALEAFTRNSWPVNWAYTHLERGTTYRNRLQGIKAENLERALADYSAALEVFIPELFPRLWSIIHMNIGNIYVDYPRGNQAENIERSIKELNATLKFFYLFEFPYNWARTRMSRGIAYRRRIRGDKAENQVQALADYNAALTVFTREDYPEEWSQVLHNRANIYVDRLQGDQAENLEQAISDFTHALEIRTREATPYYWAETRAMRGWAYSHRIMGDRTQNLEDALSDLSASLEVRTREDIPFYWAESHLLRGMIYAQRIEGHKLNNLRHALTDFETALEFFMPQTEPRHHLEIQFHRAGVLRRLGRWQETHRAYLAAREVSRLLMETASTDNERIEILDELADVDLFLKDTEALLNLQPPECIAAICVLEEGRAQLLRAALDLDIIDPTSINDTSARSRAQAFIKARDIWRKAQIDMREASQSKYISGSHNVEDEHLRLLETASLELIRARDTIRKHDDPDFLSPVPGIQDIARAIPTSWNALVYLVSGYKEGFSLIAIEDGDHSVQVEYLRLPMLTDEAISDLLLTEASHTLQTTQGKMTAKVPTGGLALGQMAVAFNVLQAWGTNVREVEAALPKGSGFQQTTRTLLDAWSNSQPSLLDQPFTWLRRKERQVLATTFESTLLNLELQRSLLQLGKLGLSEVAHTLSKLGIHSVSLIPYGRLSLFPLPAVIIQQPDGRNAHLCDLFEVTLAPSARAAEIAHQRAAHLDREARPLLLTAGNPKPRLASTAELPSAEAEATTLHRIAEKLGYPPSSICHLRPEDITKARVTYSLEQAWFAHLAVHGRYEVMDPPHSRLVLAGDEQLPEAERCLFLSEALGGRVNLKGLRLLVLSACETAVIDVLQLPNEVLGLASGFLQAGAAGVVASLWAVDDDATYLLISRFAQLYLDQKRQLTPARALAEAQRWLREEATNRVIATYDPVSPISRSQQRKGKHMQAKITTSARRALEAMPRSLRADQQESTLTDIHAEAAIRAEHAPDELPYSEPYYWAGFVVSGR